jgi:outer membrane protein assembly factor BamB
METTSADSSSRGRLRLSAFAALVLVAAGCGASHHASQQTSAATPDPVNTRVERKGIAQRALGLPPIARAGLPGYLLIADRNNNRAIIVSPSKRIVWQAAGLRGPDDTFFTPGYRSVITNEEFNDTLTEVSVRTRARIWRYGHDAVAGSSPGYLNTPDDAYRLSDGDTTIADIKNCRIVQLTHAKKVRRILGGSCVHDPPRGFASPNGDTPLPDGGLLVTEIGGWIDRLVANGNLVWSMRSPVAYPSDAQLLPSGNILVAGFTSPGRIVETTPAGRIVWSFGSPSGSDRLNKPSLAVRLPNGLIAANDDWNHRVILIDPKTKRIVWQYGHTGVPGSGPGFLNKPDGLDLLPSAYGVARITKPQRSVASVGLRQIGTLPAALAKSAAVALPGGRLLVLGGTGSDAILAGTPARLRAIGHLPASTHDAAAVLSGRSAVLYGGGEAVSQPTVLRIDPASGHVRTLHPLDEPLSDLGAARVGSKTYLVGGYTGAKYASAILRVGRHDRTTTVARLPVGLRYAGVAALGGEIYIAGGLTPSGESRAVYVFDPGASTVRRIAKLPAPEAHAALAALDGRLYLVGGRSVLRIDPANGRVSRAATLKQTLSDPNAVTVGDRIVIVGGGTNEVLSLRRAGAASPNG